MHFVAGIILSTIFQTAHVMPECDYPEPNEEGTIENNWAIHQLQTTTNYKSSKLLSWYIGGLDYQVEHHLFPNVCHIHYRTIKIVKKMLKSITFHIIVKKIMLMQYGSTEKCFIKLGRLLKKKTAFQRFFCYASAVGPPKVRGTTLGSTSLMFPCCVSNLLTLSANAFINRLAC